MAKILVSFGRTISESQFVFFNEIIISLNQKGHEIKTYENSDLINLDENEISTNLYNSEIIIVFLSSDSFNNNESLGNFIQLRNYISHKDDKILIPIIDNKLLTDYLKFHNVNNIYYDNFSDQEKNRIILKIENVINSFLGKKLAKEHVSKEIIQKIENSAPDYIKETINELKKREGFQRFVSILWYILGFIALISGVYLAKQSNNSILFPIKNENWSLTIFYAVKSAFIIILLISASKYCFNLAKTYMSESLKIADRIHAISFGEFYLKVFNDKINPSEIKEIFRDWNINNQQNEQTNLPSEDFDPKLLDKIIELCKAIRK